MEEVQTQKCIIQQSVEQTVEEIIQVPKTECREEIVVQQGEQTISVPKQARKRSLSVRWSRWSPCRSRWRSPSS